VDAQAHDAQLRRALEYWRSEVPLETNTPGRFAQNGTFGSAGHADLDHHLAARRGRLRPVRQREDRGEVQRREVRAGGHYGLANTYNPIALSTATLSWTDLNKDDMAQGSVGCVYLTPGCEINFAQLASNFGTIKPGCSLIATSGSIPCGTRRWIGSEAHLTLNYNLGIQHELMPRVSVSANWFHVDYYNLRIRNNVLQTFADYSPQQVVSRSTAAQSRSTTSAAPSWPRSSTWTPTRRTGSSGTTASSSVQCAARAWRHALRRDVDRQDARAGLR